MKKTNERESSVIHYAIKWAYDMSKGDERKGADLLIEAALRCMGNYGDDRERNVKFVKWTREAATALLEAEPDDYVLSGEDRETFTLTGQRALKEGDYYVRTNDCADFPFDIYGVVVGDGDGRDIPVQYKWPDEWGRSVRVHEWSDRHFLPDGPYAELGVRQYDRLISREEYEAAVPANERSVR